MEHFNANPYISGQDIENAQLLFDEIKATWVNNLQDYEDNDKTVPPGWRIKYFTGVKANKQTRERCYILSPSGVRFQSRARAIQYMVDNSYSSEHVIYMINQLQLEGWRFHPKLPENWRIKKKEHIKSQGSLLLTSEGLILTVKKAIEHICLYPDKYTDEDALAVEEVAKGLTKERNDEKVSWVESNDVPTGWKYRQVSLRNVPYSREYFLTDAGDTIKGRVNAIKCLLEAGMSLDDEDVMTMRQGLGRSGWTQSENFLPQGWLQKQVIGDEKKFKYLSPEFLEFKTLVDVFHFMKTNGFSASIISKVEQQLEYKEILRNKTVTRNTNNLYYKWLDGDFLPKDWKYAEKTMRWGNKKYCYLSPSGFMLNKTIEALMLMINENVDRKYLNLMSQRLELDGWKSHQSLPSFWKYATEKKYFPDNLVKKDLDFLFFTDDFRVLSKEEALKHFKENKILTTEEFSNITTLINGDEGSWRFDDHLPNNWKIKEISLSDRKMYRVKSPNNEIYDSILEAYNAMIELKINHSDLVKVMTKLKEEGFEENENLPSGWMIIRNRGDNLFELLSREGIVYQTLDSAMASINENSHYSDEERLNLENLCLDIVEEYMQSRTITVKGKRKGKTKSHLIVKEKKKPGRKKKIKRTQRFKSEDDYNFE